jgi:glutathione S-transferase
LSRKFGLAGKDELEQTYADIYANQISDLLDQFNKVRWESDETRKAELLKKLHDEIEPTQLAIFENRLAQTGSGTFVASGLTYADFYLAIVVDRLGDRREAVLAQFPHVNKLVEKVNTHPKIAEWIAKRPVTTL